MLRDDEPDVVVVRSKLDREVWACWYTDGDWDMTDLEHPGRLRDVKEYAKRTHAGGRPVRWVREDDDNWRMRIIRRRGQDGEADA
jgi:hypothetical protein